MILDSKWGFLRSGNWLVRVSCALHVPYTWQARVFVFLISKKPLHKILWTLFLPGYYRQNIIFTKYRSLMSTEKRNKKYGLRCFVKCKKFKKKHRLLPSTLGLSFYKKNLHKTFWWFEHFKSVHFHQIDYLQDATLFKKIWDPPLVA